MIKYNKFDTDCKNERAIFTRGISFTGPLGRQIFQNLSRNPREMEGGVASEPASECARGTSKLRNETVTSKASIRNMSL